MSHMIRSRTAISAAALCLWMAAGVSCTPEPSPSQEEGQAPPVVTPARLDEACYSNCIEEAEAEFNVEMCTDECIAKRKRFDLDYSVCQEICDDASKQHTANAESSCKAACFNDSDGDGVAGFADRCDHTPKGVPVGWQGCADSDGDGILDKADACPNTAASVEVSHRGCDVRQDCDSEKCGDNEPRCQTEAQCDRISETPLPRHLPKEWRQALALQVLSLENADVACPDDDTAPSQPRVVDPANIVTAQQEFQVVANFTDGQLESGSTVTLPVKWEPVTDDCGPVTYSVYFEGFYCDAIYGVEEPATYANAGWCRWMPVHYESLNDTKLDFEFKFGEYLYKIHEPFLNVLGRTPPDDGSFHFPYAPFWVRVSVMAHDANGSSSAFGMHASQHYYVLYEKAHAKELDQIPVTF